ncbi:MAG: PadR family transcriptional regulator [Gemmatimonadota bacterium]
MHSAYIKFSNQGALMAPLKPAQQLILLLLAEEPTYGVALLERIDERSGGELRLNAGSLYRMLAALVEDGFVEAIEAPRREGAGAPRKSYGATPVGKRALLAESRRQEAILDAVRALGLSEPGS